ncbi:MAG: hypothetical protein JWR20_351 [Marmoricola sp.]|nr:hypothetical protein [Marmoricola sp.]
MAERPRRLPSSSRAPRLAAVAAVSTALLAAPAAGTASAQAGTAGARDGGSRATAPHARTWQGEAMRLDQAHRTATGKGVVIALLDAGIAPGVPALKGAHIEMRASPCSYPTKHRVPVFEKGPSSEHGSLMASLLVGGGNGAGGPGTGVMGVAPDATLRFYDIDDADYSTPNTVNCDTSDVVRTVQKALRDGADVVSMSFSGLPDADSPAWARVARQASGVLVGAPITADDSPREITPPGGVPGIVSVNALDRKYFPWKKSVTLRDTTHGQAQSGWWTPAVAAPGVHIDVPGGAVGFGTGAWATGTSGPTALVAGAVALEKQKYPEATPNQLIQNLIHHTTRENLTGKRAYPDMTWVEGSGFGAVSVVNVLAHDPAGWPDVNPLLTDPLEMAATYPSSAYGKASASAPASASASPSASASAGAAAQAAPRTGGADRGHGGVPAAVWIAVVALLALVAGVAATVARRRRRTPQAPARPDGSAPSTTDDDLTRAGGQ